MLPVINLHTYEARFARVPKRGILRLAKGVSWSKTPECFFKHFDKDDISVETTFSHNGESNIFFSIKRIMKQIKFR